MTPLDKRPIQNAFYWLCSYRGNNNFFGRVLNSCRREFTDNGPIAGVRVDNEGRYVLQANIPEFNKQSVLLRICIMVHEAGHLALRHYERMLRIVGGKINLHKEDMLQEIWKLLNIAGDLAVNDLAIRPLVIEISQQAFEEISAHALFPEKYDLPCKLSLEDYFLRLMKDKTLRDKILKDISDSEIEVNCEIFANSPGEGSEGEECSKGDSNNNQDTIIRIKNLSGAELERLSNSIQRNTGGIIKTAVEQTQKCQGKIPGCMQAVIEELFSEPKVPWPIILRNQIKSVISNKIISAMTMPNISLFPLIEEGIEPYPGYNNDFTFRITCATDTSGSVSDEDFKIFMGEIVAIMRQYQGIELRYILFDHGIQLEKVFTRTSNDCEIAEISKQIHTRHGYGGTEFCAPFRRVLGRDTDRDWASEKPNTTLTPTDLLVIFTDGYAPVSDAQAGPMPSLKPPCHVIWVICKNGTIDRAMQDTVVQLED